MNSTLQLVDSLRPDELIWSDSSFDPLVHFLHEHVSDHLRCMQQIGTFNEVFATFIVGPPDHSNAGSSLHSHLVGCATTDPNTHHLVLYVPTGAGQQYTSPSEWAPVMVHIAASLLWPDLPFLVTSPDYILGLRPRSLNSGAAWDTPLHLACSLPPTLSQARMSSSTSPPLPPSPSSPPTPPQAPLLTLFPPS